MLSEDIKGEYEISIFKKFLAASKLPIIELSVKKCFPPEPDILCEHKTEGVIAFELVEICDFNMAQSISNMNEKYLWTTDPTDSIITKKIKKTYITSYPVNLLCYVDGRVVTPDNIIVLKIKHLFSSEVHSFSRVWLLGKSGSSYDVWAA